MSVLSFSTTSKGLKVSTLNFKNQSHVLNFRESLRSDDVSVLGFSMSSKGLKVSTLNFRDESRSCAKF